MAVLQGLGKAEGDASGGLIQCYFRLPYSVAVQPIYASGYMLNTPTAAPVEVRWQTSLVFQGVTEAQVTLFPAPAAHVTGSTYGNPFRVEYAPYVYVPDEEIQAVHQVSAIVANEDGKDLYFGFRALLFDPEVIRRGPLGLLALFLTH